MLNKRQDRLARLSIPVAIVIIVLGIAMIVKAFSAARAELVQERNSHLLDIAWETDRDIDWILSRGRSDLIHSAESCTSSVEHYLEDGSHKYLKWYINRVMERQNDNLCGIYLMNDGATVFYAPKEMSRQLTFKFEGERYSICTDADGREYLALSEPVGDTGFCLVGLIGMQDFYDSILKNPFGDEFWLGLYDPETNLLLQSDPNFEQSRIIDPEEALESSLGKAVLVASERDNAIKTQSYVLKTDEAADEQERLISAIPSTLTDNGIFAVAISVENAQYYDVIRNLVLKVLLYASMILAAVCVMMAMLYRHRRTNDEIREKAALLEKQNQKMQELVEKTRELAHHQRLELIGTMTSSIAHEFNNLLTPIMGYSLMVMESLPEGNEELFDNMAEIYEASFRAKTLVTRISALSRKNTGASSRMLSPDAVLKKVRDVAAPSIPKQVRMEWKLQCPDPCIFADETQLSQIALNLIINAFQAMEGSGGTLKVSTEIVGEWVELCFRDTGTGIPEDVVEHIFEPFFTTKDVSRGTGLGLAIAKQFVESFGGTIEVESKVGVGTEFCVRLPLQENLPEE